MNTEIQRIKNPKFRHRLKKTLVVLLIIFSVVGAAGIFVGYYYENTVKHIIINELNKRLNTEIVVQNVEKDIQFSLFRKFPYASVSFSNVKILDAIKTQKQKGSLLEASSVSLQFSVWDLIFGKFRIKKIEAEEGNIIIKIYKNRSDNFHFWKPSADTIASDFSLDLQKIILDDIGISYIDYGLEQDFRVFAKDVKLKGNFSEDEYKVNIDGDLFVYLIKLKNDIYFSNKSTILDVVLYVNSKEKFVEFKEGGVTIGKMLFDITGKISYGGEETYTDLRIDGKKIKVQSLINELPLRYRTSFAGYDFRGDFSFLASITGYSGKNSSPMISVTFGLKDGDIIRKQNSVKLSNVNFDANYTNGVKHSSETSRLTVTGFRSQLNDGTISGSITLKNFDKPEVDLKLLATLDLKDVFSFISTDTVVTASGKLLLQTEIKGRLESAGGFTVKDFIASNSTGTLEVQNAEIVLKGDGQNFSNINGVFSFNNNDIETDNFSGNYKSSDFKLKGKFKNIISYLFIDDQSLMIDAILESKSINMGEILEYSSSKKDTVYRMELPANVDFKLALDVREFVFKKFTASDISGIVMLKNKQVIAKNISLKAMNGRIAFSGLIDGTSPDKLLISCDASIQKVNIQKLFSEMDNLGQKTLQEKNLKGSLTANIQFASVWSSTLKVEEPTIYAKASLTIESGELIDYEPLNGLSKYLKNRDLTHVSFETLKNTIEIKDKLISIPDMEIKSSAIDFKISGTHTFDQNIDYHLSVLISQIRSAGSKQNDKVEDIGQVVDDGLHKEKYFFRITGTVDNPVYHTLDKEGYKTNIKTSLNKEKETLKEILNREFGWFKKDSSVIKNPNKKPKDKFDFNVVWDEEDTVKSLPEQY